MLTTLSIGPVLGYGLVGVLLIAARVALLRGSGTRLPVGRLVVEGAFVLAVASVLGLTLGWLTFSTRGLPANAVNLVPLRGIGQMLDTGGYAPAVAVQNLAGNVVMFVPVGLTAAILVGRRRTIRGMAVGVGLSMTVEALQFVLKLPRATDVDDVLLNGIGTAVGVAAAAAYGALTSGPEDVPMPPSVR